VSWIHVPKQIYHRLEENGPTIAFVETIEQDNQASCVRLSRWIRVINAVSEEAHQVHEIRVLPTSLRESRFSIAYSHPYERNPMTWRRYENQHPVARRTPTRPVGGSVCALASDAHAPARPHSASVMGASRGLSPRHAPLPCGSACAVVVECPQKTDGHAPSRADDGGALPAPGLCGSAERLSKVKALSQHPGRVTPGRWHPAVHPRSRLDAAA